MTNDEFKKKYSTRIYLGDCLYAHFDGYNFILSTERENGIHWVVLEQPVFQDLIQYRKKVYADAKSIEQENK